METLVDKTTKLFKERYLGRTVLAGLTAEENMALGYCLTVRSDEYKQRIARKIDDGYVKRVRIEPVGDLTEEQLKKKHILYYPCLWTIPNILPEEKTNFPYAVMTNNVITETVAQRTCAKPFKKDTLHCALNFFGYEMDELETPRLGAEVFYHHFYCKKAYSLGIITKDNFHSYLTPFLDSGNINGLFDTLSSYDENIKNSKPPEQSNIFNVLGAVSLEERTAQGLADELFELLNPDVRVSTVATVWTGKEWDIAVKNLNEN